MTALAELQHFPLIEAFLCESCQSVGNSSTKCPACASETSLAPLAAYLNRPEIPDGNDPR